METDISCGGETFKGRIENMSNSGAVVVTEHPVRLPEGEEIHLTVDCDGSEDRLRAEVIWSEAGAFGARFV